MNYFTCRVTRISTVWFLSPRMTNEHVNRWLFEERP